MAPRPRLHAFALLLATIFSAVAAPPAGALRVVDYNLLNWPGSTASVREPAYRTILSGLDADVIICQEVTSQAGVDQFVSNVLELIEPGEWVAAPFYNGPDTDNALFYKPAAVELLGVTVLPTALRDINEYRLRPVGYASSAAEIRLFSMHLKASTGSTNEQLRLAEATIVRNYANALPAGTHFVYCGDLNIYTSAEPAYQKLVGSEADDDGRGKDPINRPGSWNNNISFADIHTQSTRTGTLSPGDGGATGGLDDRFDQQIISYSLADGQGMDWIPGAYFAYGNDGAHFNLDINSGTNTAVPQAVADALQRASDHLPVVVDYQVPARAAVQPGALAFGRVLVGAEVADTVFVANVAAAPADELDFTLAAPAGFSAAAGPFQAAAGEAPGAHAVTLDTGAAGARSGDLEVSSDDPEEPLRTVALSAEVLGHARPSLARGELAASGVVDWGVVSPGAFPEMSFAVYNFGFGSLQALLEPVSAAVGGGDGRFAVTPDPGNPAQVGADSALFRVTFDDEGATPDSLYEASVTVTSRDESGLPGALPALSPLTVTLRAEVSLGAVAADPVPAIHTAFYRPWPNPASAALTLRFDLARPAAVRIDLFDLQGRRVADVAHGDYPAGRHQVGWAAARTAPAPGVYFVRFRGDGVERAYRVVLLP